MERLPTVEVGKRAMLNLNQVFLSHNNEIWCKLLLTYQNVMAETLWTRPGFEPGPAYTQRAHRCLVTLSLY